MKWELSGNDAVIIDNNRFSIGLKWHPVIKSKSAFVRKFKNNALFIKTNVTTVCVVDSDKMSQVGSSEKGKAGEIPLASCFFGSKNTVYFCKVTDEFFWVVGFDSDGNLDILDHSDSLVDILTLQNYIGDFLQLTKDETTFRLINLGEKTFLEDPVLDVKVEDEALTIEDLGRFIKSSIKTFHYAGGLRNKLYTGGAILICGFLGGTYLYLNNIPQSLIDIQGGQYSEHFTSKYNQLKKAFNEVERNERASKIITKDKLFKIAKEEFNNYVYSKNLSNLSILDNALKIRQEFPLILDGWSRQEITYKENKFSVTYKRDGEYPLSNKYIDLDIDIKNLLHDSFGVVVSPISLSPRGDVRVYDININSSPKKEYTKYLAERNLYNNKKQELLKKIKRSYEKLNGAKSNIEDIESSVENFGIFERRSKEVEETLISEINEIKQKNKKELTIMSNLLGEISGLKPIEPILNKTQILNEMDISSKVIPLFQSTNLYSWTTPAVSRKFPSVVLNKKLKGITALTGYVVKINIKDGVFGVQSVGNLINKPYVFIDKINIIQKSGKSDFNIEILINELNQDFIL